MALFTLFFNNFLFFNTGGEWRFIKWYQCNLLKLYDNEFPLMPGRCIQSKAASLGQMGIVSKYSKDFEGKKKKERKKKYVSLGDERASFVTLHS